MSVNCSPECVNIGCQEPDWLEKHNSFVLTFATLLGGGVGVILTYFLKSRCEEIRCFCIYCKRKVIETTDINLEQN